MSENVHYHSWPLDRSFTFAEWCDYLKAHEGDSSQVVATFGDWKFNVHGVCLNRRLAVRKFINRTGAEFSVETFQSPAGRKLGNPLAWNFSAHYSDGTGGGSAGWGEVTGDENDAIKAGLEKVAEAYDRSVRWYQAGGKAEEHYPGRVKICQQGAMMARTEILDRCQMTLF